LGNWGEGRLIFDFNPYHPITLSPNYLEREEEVVKNMGSIMKQAQKIQAEIARVQQELSRKTVEASSGGGMVTAVANGKQEIISVKIEPEVVTSGDIEMIQDLVLAAVNEVLKKSQEMIAEEMRKITGGLNIPGLGSF
jgi:DNA-binding YbaB/EbfC family protein